VARRSGAVTNRDIPFQVRMSLCRLRQKRLPVRFVSDMFEHGPSKLETYFNGYQSRKPFVCAYDGLSVTSPSWLGSSSLPSHFARCSRVMGSSLGGFRVTGSLGANLSFFGCSVVSDMFGCLGQQYDNDQVGCYLTIVIPRQVGFLALGSI
jgi:hypothetical protein